MGWGIGHVVLGVREKRQASLTTRNSNFLALGLGVPPKFENLKGGWTFLPTNSHFYTLGLGVAPKF